MVAASGTKEKRSKWTTLEAQAVEVAIGAEDLATLLESAGRRKEKEKESLAKAKANMEVKAMAREEAKDGRREDSGGDI
jgi:hypothetical protein